ncbi:Exosome complex exonuclease RRP45 [Candidatus Nitrosotalea sp. TS]|uniref:exosome complex protein Rrp42 n=1 Tax=Candidatus Nitrosotalea sp. TS TaxID=2341020 RepID=UPI00140AC037|nr:exosome complex protein Rrp42 [Candidatus Nitrosotalea sp. TS]MDE1826525.1 exosome complex protein Rrp42 [Nitrososphaerota archaeon]MDE1873179.1 exosome complex protein Rrp42 [Nitrososphaerota archaeon]NHI04471.1 Exosome complex exonuclease RRP45 [Candidatus Nitrosotalea sp. TS]
MESVIIDQLKRDKILDLLKQGKRLDGRALDEQRPLSIETGVIPKANGSARVKLGNTEVITGVKVQPDKPFPDLGDKGILICTAEILPLADPHVEPGPPTEEVIELARVVDRGIRETEMIDLHQLVLIENKSVVGIFIDSSVIDSDGNLFDACSYASVSAVLSSTIPKYEIKDEAPVLVEGVTSKPPVKTLPVSVTMARIGDYIIVDPTKDEEACMDARITITTNSAGNICALQKGGEDGFSVDQLLKCSELALSVGTKIRKKLEQLM